MTKQKTILALGLAALLGSGLALADHDHKGHKHGGPRQDVVALEQSKISAAQAIAIAEKETNATADSLDLEMKRGAAVYDIELFDSAQEYEIRVDAVSGEIVGRKSEQKANLPAKSAISLTQAVETAEGQGKGKVVEADLDGRRDGSVVYEVKVINSDGSRYDIDVSAADGIVLRSEAHPDKRGKRQPANAAQPAPAAEAVPAAQ
jgi:hypothetical protein